MPAGHTAADLGWTRAGIERELESAQREVRVDVRHCVNRRGNRRAEQRHLQPSVFFQPEPAVLWNGLTTGSRSSAPVHTPAGLLDP
jgi:hypothetical protein